MVSNRQRGNKSQLIVKKFYESQGWKVHNQRSSWQRIRGHWMPVGNDIWGAFDHVGMHADLGFLFIQSKTGGAGIQDAKRKIETLPWPRDDRFGMNRNRLDLKLHVGIVIVKRHIRHGRPYGTYLRVIRWNGTTWNVGVVELSGAMQRS